MIKRQFFGFVARWALSTFGIWICIRLFGQVTGEYGAWNYVLAGLILSLVNSVVRPLATLFALPLIVLTMGLATIVLNFAMVALAFWLIPDVDMPFWGIVASFLVLSLVNYLINLWITPRVSGQLPTHQNQD